MGSKRKAPSHGYSDSKSRKRKRTHAASETSAQLQRSCPHSLLGQFYHHVSTLRQYLASKFPASHPRRRRISTYRCADPLPLPYNEPVDFLDRIVVGTLREQSQELDAAREKDYAAFTQTQQRLTTGTGSSQSGNMQDLVDFAIWTLFRSSPKQPRHLLCNGLERVPTGYVTAGQDGDNSVQIPAAGLSCQSDHERLLKGEPWNAVLHLLGQGGNVIMRSLLLDCGLFVPFSNNKENLYQFSGIPLCDLLPISNANGVAALNNSCSEPQGLNGLSHIKFVRYRMFYARPSSYVRGNVRSGLHHNHVFNRYPEAHNPRHTAQILRYIFPRQFGLHNVFTSQVDTKETAQRFKDYTLRDHEINNFERINPKFRSKKGDAKIPKRLRGQAWTWVRKLQKAHKICSFTQLLRHYCPLKVVNADKMNGRGDAKVDQYSAECFERAEMLSSKFSRSSRFQEAHENERMPLQDIALLRRATPTASVSAFCQAVLRQIVPVECFGYGSEGETNRIEILRHVDQFIRMRKYETLSLHTVSQSVKIRCLLWTGLPRTPRNQPLSASDQRKRVELFNEFLYYLFDSILIPLVQTNFYVTESNKDRNRLFYFRHDVWQAISEPSLNIFRLSMCEELPSKKACRMLNANGPGWSKIRLLPKENGVRPIINLRRKQIATKMGKSALRPSINAYLTPVFSMLNFEKIRQPKYLRSAIFSVGEIHDRLKEFRLRIRLSETKSELYFAKVDVKSCFDTIPQSEILNEICAMMSEDQYRISRYAELKSLDGSMGATSRRSRRFVSLATAPGETFETFLTKVDESAKFKKRTVYAKTHNDQVWHAKRLKQMLEDHVRRNLVRIGTKHYVQKKGIPQGSILSTLLCSFFYGSFESQVLGFLQGTESLLLRLIDDFLLITLNKHDAERFLKTMFEGNDSYGITVNPKKSFANFPISIRGTDVPNIQNASQFSYCSMLINTQTLEVMKDRARSCYDVGNTLTVEHSSAPGHSFRRKMLAALKIQMHAMLLDTSFNDWHVVILTLYQNFLEVGMKLHRYVKNLPKNKQPTNRCIISTIDEVLRLAFTLSQGKRSKAIGDYKCSITIGQTIWLGASAFETVLRRKQARYTDVLAWLGRAMYNNRPSLNLEDREVELLAKKAVMAFAHCRY